jgi:rare lipoprotein A
MAGLRRARPGFGAARAGAIVLLASAGLAACVGPTPRNLVSPPPAAPGGPHGTDKPYRIDGKWYYPKPQPDYDEVGIASWYGPEERDRRTADGERFDQYGLSAAHKTLPLPSIVEVTNLANGRRVRVRLNDRGPFVDGRLIDLSRGAAEQLGFDRQGVARVRVRYIGPAPTLAAEAVGPATAAPTPTRRVVIETSAPAAAPPPTPDTAKPANASVYRVQAGAYSTRESAERAAALLGAVGPCAIEPVERGGAVLYRVVLGGFEDADAAAAAQSRVSAAGFAGARVLKPF